MFTRELLGLFPRKRIRAADGMAVTADVWEEAHEYHRLYDRFHTLLYHGAGIVVGLEVIASDPPDSALYVRPGLAVDSIGQTIFVPEPRAYDIGRADGMLYLVLSYAESRAQRSNGQVQEDAPLYVQAQYALEAVEELPATPHIELARVFRRDGATVLTDAKDPNHPQAGEIDLRFRATLGQQTHAPLALGVITLPGAESTRHGEGMANLAASMRQSALGQVWVDPDTTIGPGLERYALLYLVGRETFTLTPEQMTLLHAYRERGGTLFFESCRAGQPEGNPPADAAFAELLGSFGIKVGPVAAGHELMRTPYLFAVPPDGFETLGSPSVRVGDGVLVSTFDFGCLWRGERRGRPAARSEIRNGMEWGANIVTWAAARRRRALAAAASSA